jgi:hypothetical protein
MYFGSGTPRLNHALKDLRVAWDATEDGWRDKLRVDMGENYVEPLAAQATITLRAMDELADLFARIYRDCSDSR